MSAEPARPFDWNGPGGERWVENQVRLDRMLAPYGNALRDAADARPGEQVLDVGCGAGATSLDLAARVAPDGRVTGVDISRALIRRARELTGERGPPVKFMLADAAARVFDPIHDLIVSRFGVMFFDDPVPAFANLRAALKPEGRLAFVCWRGPLENDWTRLPMTAIRDIVPPPPPADPEAPGPFSFGDPARVERILTQAGFIHVRIVAVDHPVLFGVGPTPGAAVEDAVANAVKVGPLERALKDQPDEVKDRALAAVRQAYRDRLTPDGVVIDAAGWMVTARNG
ncbi:MAG: class I SAM-dependent methyltransferase [Brevundimonas sp.]|nr:MAG: class I SAM-dependent methyltransferase [Brevundimonas sp.]